MGENLKQVQSLNEFAKLKELNNTLKLSNI